jgi:hypothetical protein
MSARFPSRTRSRPITVTLDALAFLSDLLIQRENVRPGSLSLIARDRTAVREV